MVRGRTIKMVATYHPMSLILNFDKDRAFIRLIFQQMELKISSICWFLDKFTMEDFSLQILTIYRTLDLGWVLLVC